LIPGIEDEHRQLYILNNCVLKIHTCSGLQRLKNPVISIGVFDGVHKGHAAVFTRVRQRAMELEGESAIVTFWPHPRFVLGKNENDLKLLTTLDEKKLLIRRHGIDHLFILPFTREFARLPACSFVRQYLVEGAGLVHLVFGYDHHFGRKREGNFENLRQCATLYGFGIEQLEPVTQDGVRVSSSAIRTALSVGNVKLASQLLSYDYSIRGTITGGRRVGRILGFPTANVEPEDRTKVIPADGVYAVIVTVGKKSFMGMMNIGIRPTLNESQVSKSLEVHLIDFDGDIYNQSLTISFIERIRDERKFGNLGQLKEQLAKDKALAIKILTS
jgi:riboflavin kinase / FMN adenylyltransferase